MPNLKASRIILIIIGGLILIGLILGFICWQKYVKTTSEIFPPVEEAEDLCAKFSKAEGEITCQQAREAALENYPGEVKSIKKTEADLTFGAPPDITIKQRKVWLIEISLEKPIKGGPLREIKMIEIAVDRIDGTIHIIFLG
jgi:hypothetical protein